MSGQNKNDTAWEQLFAKQQILAKIAKHGYADITTDEIREWREPRLMAKIDHEDNLPLLFKQNGLSIVTLSTSRYRIGPYKSFQALPNWTFPNGEVEILRFPPDLETLDFLNLTSEPGVINTANATSMLQSFTGEELLLTVAGRMRTPAFEYRIDTSSGGSDLIPVTGAQIEIDAGYEGRSKLVLFEVKNHASKDFNIRQLYYPYRTWQQRVQKEVVPVFLTFSNDVFDFYQFEFAELENYSSARLTKHSRFMLEHSKPSVDELAGFAFAGKGTVNRTGAPFPQADNFERVVDLVNILIEQPQTVDDLASHYGFDPRQSDYYFNAARYLGLAFSRTDEFGQKVREATPLATEIFQKSFRQKYLSLAKQVLNVDSISRCYLRSLQQSEIGISEISAIFEESHDSDKFPGSAEKLERSTIDRRAQTIRGWLNWLNAITR